MSKQKSWTILDLTMISYVQVQSQIRSLFNNYNIPKLDKDTAAGFEHDILESEVLTVEKK